MLSGPGAKLVATAMTPFLRAIWNKSNYCSAVVCGGSWAGAQICCIGLEIIEAIGATPASPPILEAEMNNGCAGDSRHDWRFDASPRSG